MAVAAGATGRVLLTVVAPARCRYCARAAATTDCALLVTRVAAVPEPALIGLRSTSDLVSVEETVIDAGDIDDDDDDAAAYDVEITFEETGVDAVNTALMMVMTIVTLMTMMMLLLTVTMLKLLLVFQQ